MTTQVWNILPRTMESLHHTSAQLQMKKKGFVSKICPKKKEKKGQFFEKKGEKRIGKSVFFWSFFQTDR